MVRLEQKTWTNPATNETIAFVECTIVDGNYTYSCRFDEKTKARYNNMCRAKGFRVGKIANVSEAPAKVVEF